MRNQFTRAGLGLGILCMALLMGKAAVAGGLAPPTRGTPGFRSDETTAIGHLAWEITETSTGRMLGKGSRDVQVNEVLVITGESPDDYLEQRIPLSDGFYLKLNSGRDKKPFAGFGMAAGRDDEETFCWEWFQVNSAGRARKIQEKGELDFRMEQIGDRWEIARTRFLTDISMRVRRWSDTETRLNPHVVTWRVTILKGSELEWPTVAGRNVLLPADAGAWLAAHPPPPGFWSRLLKAASERSPAQPGK